MPEQKEIIIKKSKTDKFIGYAGILIVFIWGSYTLTFHSDWKGLIGILLSLSIFIVHHREFKGMPILLKITPDQLWTPKHGYKPWKSVFKVCFARTYSGKTYRTYLEIYKSETLNPDETIDITNSNIFKFRLKSELRKYVQVESVSRPFPS